METKKSALGFSIIELLLVIVTIGILFTIAIPIFVGHFANSHDAGRQVNIQRTVLAVTVDGAANSSATYPNTVTQVKTVLSNNGVDPYYDTNRSCYIYGSSVTGNDFFVAVESQKYPNTFFVDGSVAGKSQFEIETNLKTEMGDCGVLTTPTDENTYSVFYIQ